MNEEETNETTGKGGSRIAVILLVVALLGSVGAGIWLKLSADSATQDAQAALADTESELSDAEAANDDLTSQVASLESDNATLESENAALEDDLESVTTEAEETSQAVAEFVAASMVIQGVGEDDAACVSEKLVESTGPAELLTGLVQAFLDPFAPGILGLGADMLDAADECGLSADFFDPGVTETFVDLDALYAECESGSGAACDELYWTSPVGSEYERFGATCGDRYTIEEAPATCPDA